ncbi:uncharacterized protein LOC143202440 [Rhynchophorus ferrugineus]|uniref:C2H2-type domain-containing protein n=1 Tax=Rhynchophorus ferrugineus TaxID=354439 RepID=A0A834HXD8_RHYFE|nr:hypothetical protein GWI33_017831 [Rhynchophorus ferrugineus]
MTELKEEDSIVIEEDEDDTDQGDVFRCKYCEFQTENIDELDEHIINHDEAILEDNNDACDALEHQEDDQVFSLKKVRAPYKKKEPFSVKPPRVKLSKLLSEPGGGNRTIFVCPYCSMQTTKKSEMTQHLQDHTSPVELPIYACSECPYATRRKCDMPKHLLTHCEDGNVPMYKCPQCTYATKRKGDLPKHLLCHKKPELDELYTCTLCPYSTKRKGDLKKHLMSHESDSYLGKDGSTYNCTECGYTSRRLNDLHKHVILHRDKQDSKNLKCIKCQFSTTMSNLFARHVLSNCSKREVDKLNYTKETRTSDYIVLQGEPVSIFDLKRDVNVRRKRRREESDVDDEQYGKEGEQSNRDKVLVLTGYDGAEDSSEEQMTS